MAVFRIEKTRDYTVMSNHHLRDRALRLTPQSDRPVGIKASKPDFR